MIEKITDQNLERYDSRLKEWCDRKFFEKGNYGKYQTTEEAGAVAFYPVPNTPLEGKVKFSFKETMPVEGVKGPDNPSTITGVSNINITRCGKNLIKLPFFSTGRSYIVNGVQFTLDHTSGTIIVNGTATDLARLFFVGANSNILLASEKTYFISGCPNNGNSSTYYIGAARYTKNNEYLSSLSSDFGTGRTWVSDINCYFVSSAVIAKNATVSNLIFKPQLELGSFATSFEPYQGNDYTIQLGDTYYGGEIDLATGMMTVTHIMSEIDGSVVDGGLDALTNTFPIVIHIPESILPSATGYIISSGCTCDKFPLANNQDDVEHIVVGQFYRYRQFRMYLSFSRCEITQSATLEERVAAAKTWLNNNHVKLVLNLREDYRYTIQLTPQQIFSLSQIDKYTPRLNTVYTNADSIQISYLKSPIRDEYEKTQAILSLGGNS